MLVEEEAGEAVAEEGEEAEVVVEEELGQAG